MLLPESKRQRQYFNLKKRQIAIHETHDITRHLITYKVFQEIMVGIVEFKSVRLARKFSGKPVGKVRLED
jgi:hypothetical protein